MKRRTWRRISQDERLRVYQAKGEPTTFSVRWVKSSGGYGRRVFSAPSIAEAISVAPYAAGLEFTAKPAGLDVVDAFAMVLKQSGRGERSKGDWFKSMKRFVVWLTKRYPDCRLWHQVSRQVVREYIGDTLAGRAPNTIRLVMQPVRQTSRYMAREYGLPDAADGLGVGNKLVRPTPAVHLTDVLDFLAWLRQHEPALEAAAALQSLAGMRLSEVVRLTWAKIDLGRGLVEISGEVKNRHSERVIPICNRVVEALRRAERAALAALVQEIGGRAFPWETDRYGHLLGWAMRKFNLALKWCPKDLRNCLPQLAKAKGIHATIWEDYMGHAARGVTAIHYQRTIGTVSRGQREALEGDMALFREHVISHVEKAIGEYEEKRRQQVQAAAS